MTSRRWIVMSLVIVACLLAPYAYQHIKLHLDDLKEDKAPRSIVGRCGDLFEKPDMSSKVIGSLDPCPAKVFFDKVLPPEDGKGRIEVLKDTEFGGLKLKKGDILETGPNEGEGVCAVDTPAGFIEMAMCVWLPGYTDRQEDTFKVLLPAGKRQWYHLVSEKGQSGGWYITTPSDDMDPVFRVLPARK